MCSGAMDQWNPYLDEPEMQRRAWAQWYGSTTMILQPPSPAAFTPHTAPFPPARNGRKIKASMMAGAHGVHFTGRPIFMNVAADLVLNGATVEGVHFRDAIEGSEGEEIEVDYLEHSSGLRMDGSGQHVNVGGAVRYIPAGQHGVAPVSSRVQKADINAHMFKNLRDSEINGGQFTNVAGNMDYVGASESAPSHSQGNLF